MRQRTRKTGGSVFGAAFLTREKNKCRNLAGPIANGNDDREGPPQNDSKILPFSGSRNGPYKEQKARQTFQTKLHPRKPAETLGNLPQLAKLSGNHAETLQKPWKPAQNVRNPAETLTKPCRNPRKLAENLQKPFGNPAETQENPYIHLLKIKNI